MIKNFAFAVLVARLPVQGLAAVVSRSPSSASLSVSGKENEVLELAEYHMTTKHGVGKEGIREKVHSFLKHEAYAR